MGYLSIFLSFKSNSRRFVKRFEKVRNKALGGGSLSNSLDLTNYNNGIKINQPNPNQPTSPFPSNPNPIDNLIDSNVLLKCPDWQSLDVSDWQFWGPLPVFTSSVTVSGMGFSATRSRSASLESKDGGSVFGSPRTPISPYPRSHRKSGGSTSSFQQQLSSPSSNSFAMYGMISTPKRSPVRVSTIGVLPTSGQYQPGSIKMSSSSTSSLTSLASTSATAQQLFVSKD